MQTSAERLPPDQGALPTLRRQVTLVLAVALVAWLAGALAFVIPAWIAGILAVGAGLSLGRMAGSDDRVALPLAYLLAAALIATGLVPTSGRYLPVLLVGVALVSATVPELWRQPRALVLPDRFVAIAAIMYLLWFAIATVTSSQRSVSIEYLAGAIGTLALALFIMPTLLQSAGARRGLLALFGGLGLAVVAAGLVIAITGPISINGLVVGDYPLLQLTILGHETPFSVPRVTGPYLSPSNESVVLVIALLALLGLHEGARAWRRQIVLGIAVCMVGLASTFDRNGLLALAAGAGLYAAIHLVQRRTIGLPAIVSVLAAGLLATLLLNVTGATSSRAVTARPGPQPSSGLATMPSPGPTESGAPEVPNDEIQVRGGTSLSGRDKLWQASIQAIASRPVFGSGPGTNVEAIAPFVDDQLYKGLTSHDTWLRTGVELGLPGLLLLLAFVAGVLRWIWRRARHALLEPWNVALVAIFVALLFAFTFETFLLGGLTYGSVVLPLSAGILVGADAHLSGNAQGSGSAP